MKLKTGENLWITLWITCGKVGGKLWGKSYPQVFHRLSTALQGTNFYKNSEFLTCGKLAIDKLPALVLLLLYGGRHSGLVPLK